MKFKLNQRVWSCQHGWGTVVEISDCEYYPVTVNFDAKASDSYTASGKLHGDELLPTLFLNEVKDWPDSPPPKPDLEVDHPLWVKDANQEHWSKRHFSHWTEGGKPACFIYGGTSWSCQPSSVTNWEMYSLEDPTES